MTALGLVGATLLRELQLGTTKAHKSGEPINTECCSYKKSCLGLIELLLVAVCVLVVDIEAVTKQGLKYSHVTFIKGYNHRSVLD